MTNYQNRLSRRNLIKATSAITAALVVGFPSRAFGATRIDALRTLGMRIQELYPARSARLSAGPNPRLWPHPRQEESERILFVDSWLLPVSVATIAVDAAGSA